VIGLERCKAQGNIRNLMMFEWAKEWLLEDDK
jgi:hypothetical protein